MTTKRNAYNTMFLFNISQSSAEKDESSIFYECVNHLAHEFIPFSTFRFAFISRDSDDFLYAVHMKNEYYDILKEEDPDFIKRMKGDK